MLIACSFACYTARHVKKLARWKRGRKTNLGMILMRTVPKQETKFWNQLEGCSKFNCKKDVKIDAVFDTAWWLFSFILRNFF